LNAWDGLFLPTQQVLFWEDEDDPRKNIRRKKKKAPIRNQTMQNQSKDQEEN
jgi:hypothetical protein